MAASSILIVGCTIVLILGEDRKLLGYSKKETQFIHESSTSKEQYITLNKIIFHKIHDFEA